MNTRAIHEIGNGNNPTLLKANEARSRVYEVVRSGRCRGGCLRYALLEDMETAKSLNPREAIGVLLNVANSAVGHGMTELAKDCARVMVAASKASGCVDFVCMVSVEKFGLERDEALEILDKAPSEFREGRSIHPSDAQGLFLAVAQLAKDMGYGKVAKAAAELMLVASKKEGSAVFAERQALDYGLSPEEIKEVISRAPGKPAEKTGLMAGQR